MLEAPPDGFNEAFFAWLDRVSDELFVTFASKLDPKESNIAEEVEQRIGFPLPEDIRLFYSRYYVWGVFHASTHEEWVNWDQTLRVKRKLGTHVPLVPIENGGCSAGGYAVLAAVESSERYWVIVYSRATGRVLHIYESLRAYFIGEVEDEVKSRRTWRLSY
jgi:hypothetical protein